MRRRSRVVAVGHEHDVAVTHGFGHVGPVLRAVQPLHGERTGRLTLRAVVVDLLEHDLAGWIVYVVLVRRVARPVPCGSEHFDDEETLRGKLGLEDVIDLTGCVAGAAHLDLYVLGCDEPWL